MRFLPRRNWNWICRAELSSLLQVPFSTASVTAWELERRPCRCCAYYRLSLPETQMQPGGGPGLSTLHFNRHPGNSVAEVPVSHFEEHSPGAPLFCFGFCFWLCGLWDLSSLGIKPMLPAVEAWSLTHWTSREVPGGILKSFPFTYEGSCNVSNSESESGREENNPRKPGFQSSLWPAARKVLESHHLASFPLLPSLLSYQLLALLGGRPQHLTL